MTESWAIFNYYCRKFNLYPTDLMQQYHVERAIGVFKDLITKVMSSVYINNRPAMTGHAHLNEEERKEIVKTVRGHLMAEYVPGQLKMLNECLGNVGVANDGKVAVSDLMIYGGLKNVMSGNVDHV